MLSATTAETTAFINQKLPTEIIGIICEFSDLKTHNALRSTCSSVRLYVPLRKVVGFEAYKELVECYIFIFRSSWEDFEIKKTEFQERIHLDLHHDALTQDQVEYLQQYEMDFELCRISRKALDHPVAYKGIDMLFGDCYFLAAAARVGDLELLIRLLQVPLMDPAADVNGAIRFAACNGRHEIVHFLLQDPRVDPSSKNNYAISLASKKGHLAVVQALLLDPRVDPSDAYNRAIRSASKYGHLAVLQTLLLDPRVDPSDSCDWAIRLASENGHLAVLQTLLQDPRVDPSVHNNYPIIRASRNGHVSVVRLLLQDSRVVKLVMLMLARGG